MLLESNRHQLMSRIDDVTTLIKVWILGVVLSREVWSMYGDYVWRCQM